MSRAAAPSAAPVPMPEAGALAAGPRGAVWVSAEGEIEELALAEAGLRAGAEAPLVCHAVALARRLGVGPFAAYDVLELFAFVRPAAFCLPTARGLADALGLARPADLTGEAAGLIAATRALLGELAEGGGGKDGAPIASVMGRAGWAWGPAVLAALGSVGEGGGVAALDVWNRLKPWREQAPEPAPGHEPVSAAESRQRLAELLRADAEPRPEQADYAAGAAAAFAPRDKAGAPHVVLAEAGTGIGKTLGYIAPASLWAQKNEGAVWISTFTKNLQRQIDQELDRLYPNPREKAEKAVVRKGRENYLCLLNLEEAAGRAGTDPRAAIALGLIARWALRSRDGDMVGGDFPSWLAELLGHRSSRGLTDRRGECIYSACGHYQKCFIERAVRKARRAELVIANHALVMVQAVLGTEDRVLPTRYVFDEGHHLFDAADGAFSASLSGVEMAELRRWVLGAEGRGRGRARGLKRRVEDLVAGEEVAAALEGALAAARALPGEGWLGRLGKSASRGPGEAFLALARDQVLARSGERDTSYSLEAPAAEPVPGLVAAAARLEVALAALAAPLMALAKGLAARLDDDAEQLDGATRQRIEAVCRGLARRGEVTLGAWRRMLVDLDGQTPEAFVDWFSIDRVDGREVDCGMHRHWLDPTVPFAETVLARAHGALITSATLRDRSDAAPEDWATAEVRTGALHLPLPAKRLSLASPFDYAAQTRVLIVNDVRRTDGAQVAAAYRELFLAAGGGALGLFTAIRRLRQVHERIAGPLDEAGLTLHAQHVDAIDTPTLVDIFRAEEDSCLLGTDAVRDGVDVPGRALRLIVFDRVPWPRPDILHRARRKVFGGGAYDDMLARLRLKQAYGRLIRRADDTGVFVLLDAMTPSRLLSAFPEGVTAQRLGLADAIAETARFLAEG